MRRWLCLSFLLATLDGAPAIPSLRYTLIPQNGGLSVEVALAHVGTETDLVLPTASGDAVGLERGVMNLRAIEGEILAAPSAGRVRLRTVKGRARIGYDLVQDWQGELRESVRHRPHLDRAHVEINSANGLVHPWLDLAQTVDCTFDWRLPAGWALATSFGASEPGPARVRQRFRGAWNEVQNAMFAVGDFRLQRSRLGRGEVVIAMRGTLGFPDAEAKAMILRLLRMTRGFWRDEDFPYFLVTLAPFGPGGSGNGGGGFTNAFSLYTAAGGPFADRLPLIAHETFHTWNPLKMGRIRSPQENTNWFTEGFTTYYESLLLWQAGLLPDGPYLASVNRILRDYHGSPARHTTLQELIHRPRQDAAKSRIPYERGAMIALWLDDAIRRQSAGAASVDTLMRELFAERKQHADLTKERIFAAIGRHVGADELAKVRTYVEAGVLVEAPPTTRVPCAQRAVTEMAEFELGMDRTALIEQHRVVALQPGSAAEQAGLRENDVVIGTSIYWNDASQPVKLTIRGGKRVQYLPQGPRRSIPQYGCP